MIEVPPIGGDPSGRTRPGSEPAQLDKCASCPKLCRHACPVACASADEAHVPSVKATAWRRIASGLDAPSASAMRDLFACTDCNMATRYCRHDVEPGQMLAPARAFAQQHGLAPAALRSLVESLVRRHSPFEPPPAAFLDRLAAMATPGATLVYLPGCATLRHAPGAAEAACLLLAAAGQPFDVLPAPCSGAPAYYAGRIDLMAAWQTELAQRLPARATLVSSCPTAVTSLRRGRPDLRSLHLATYLAGCEQLPLQRRLGGSFVLHDPCHLARQQADPQAPRLLLQRALDGGRLVEPAEHGAETVCCGGGGLLPLVFPRLARRMARGRLASLARVAPSGATLVTACPACQRQLSRGSRFAVADLATVLARSLR